MEVLLIDIGALATFLAYMAIVYWRGVSHDAQPPRSIGFQEVHRNMPTRIAATQPHCSSVIRSRNTSAAKASVTSG